MRVQNIQEGVNLKMRRGLARRGRVRGIVEALTAMIGTETQEFTKGAGYL